MKTKPNQTKLKQLLLGVLCVSALNFSAFAKSIDITENTTESNKSYDDSDTTTRAALNVTTNGVTYNGTNITLNIINTGSSISGDPVGKGVYINNGAILSLTDSSITASGTDRKTGLVLYNGSSGTLNNVNIQGAGYYGYAVYANANSTLLMTGGSVTTNGTYGHGVGFNAGSSGTLNNVNIQTAEASARGVSMESSSLVLMTGGSINSKGTGMTINGTSNVTADSVTVVSVGNGLAANTSSTLTLTDSDVRVTGSGAYGLSATGTGTINATLNGNTLSSTGSNGYSINASTSGTVTLTGSNGSLIDGDVRAATGGIVDITITTGSELRGNFIQAASTINLSLGAGVLLKGSGELDSLTLENGAIIGYTGTLRVTDSITIGEGIIIDFSDLTETGDYVVFDWSGATGGSDISAAQFNLADTGVDGTFSVENNQLTFNATAVPEPSTYFLIGAGLGALLLAVRLRGCKV